MIKRLHLKKVFLWTTLSVFSIFVGCSDQDDDLTVVSGNLEVQDFVWKAMNLFYFWQSDVADLADDRFATNEEYSNFLNGFSSPEDLFYNICFDHEVIVGANAAVDRFSFITDDYNDLLAINSGEFTTNGVDFGLIAFSGSDDIFGYVRYILPNTDAATKDIQRGDLFLEVDGQQLTRQNFRQLLFGTNTTYTLSLAEIQNGTDVVLTGETVELIKAPYTENPVFIAKTLDVNGTSIGYLMYNSFTGDFDNQLNDAFATFAGVDALVVDVRYNGGGSVRSATRMASMVTGQFSGQLFLREQWNEKLQPNFGEDNNFVTTIDGNTINSLNLDQLYVLTSDRSASASEQLINGLEPYIDVIQVGDVTEGKNEFSVALYDSPSLLFDDPDLNPNHTYGILPLAGRMENAAGFSDYTSGLAPDIVYVEDLANLGILGEADEPLLAAAIADITGISRGTSRTASFTKEKDIADAKFNTLVGQNSYVEPRN